MQNDTQKKEMSRKKILITIGGVFLIVPTGVSAYMLAALFGGYEMGLIVGMSAVLALAGFMLFLQTLAESTIESIEVKIQQET